MKPIEDIDTMNMKHNTERSMLLSAFKQIKDLKEGKLKTRSVDRLLDECRNQYMH